MIYVHTVQILNSGAQLGAALAYHYLNCLPAEILPSPVFFYFFHFRRYKNEW